MADFNFAITIVIRNEGGYVNNPADPGGETKYGISKRSYPSVDIKNLTVDQAEDIYRRDFWIFGGIVEQSIANKLFDMYVNEKHSAIHVLQSVLGIAADGVYGKMTEAAVNAVKDVTNFLSNYRAALAQHYRDIVQAKPSDAVFLNGWLRRAGQ